MTRQKLARLKLKAYTAGKIAAMKGERCPPLPDFSGSMDELETILNAATDGYAEGLRKLEANESYGPTH